MQRTSRLLAIGFALLLGLPAAQAATFTAALSGANENPPTASTGVGATFVILDTTAHTLRVNAAFSGLTANTTAAHIHCCVAPPGNVGVATMLPSFAGFPLGVTSGAFDQTYDTTLAASWSAAFITANGGTPAGAEAALAAGLAAGQAYLNIHSVTFPGGELRGFLALQPPAGLIGPTPYLSKNDSPFLTSINAGTTFLETFESGGLATPGVTASAGAALGPGGLTDSVDGDDGSVDGSGLGGYSFFSGGGSTGITFTFDATVLGTLPTQVGIVWTDGGGTTLFEAFGPGGVPLGQIGPVAIADGSNSGTTAEDRFFGATNPGGISAIRISNSAGGIEVDHLQYGIFGTAPPLPTLSINNVSANEGNSGTTPFVFTVTLSASSASTVTVSFATADGTATAGSDYIATSGVLTFNPGVTTQTITVNVNGDTTVEPNETFLVNLSAPTNATIATGLGTGTIVNDDVAALPTLSINNVSANEGNSGTTPFVFTVTLSASSASTVTVSFATADGTATAGSDYIATSGVLTFNPGQTTQTITVNGNGDTTVESNEAFFVNLSGASNATIAVTQGTGTIVNDDAPPPAANVAIPTLNDWALVGLALLLAGVAMNGLRRRWR